MPVTVLEEEFEKGINQSLHGSARQELTHLKNKLNLKMDTMTLMNADETFINQLMSQKIKKMFGNVRMKKNL